MKHTPGPWRYSNDDQTVYAKSMRGDTGEFMVADIRGWGHLQYLPDGDKIQDANGKLMAEAPNLLHTLELCLACKPHKESVESMKQMIHAAIKKATE